MKKNDRRLGRAAAYAASALLLTLAAMLCYMSISRAAGEPLPTVFGWGNAVVLSGSMEPTLPVGALLLTHEKESYSPGDVVIYEDENGTLVTHRLVSITDGEALTKGDANNAEDKPFPASRIRGRVEVILPGVGSTILWLKTPSGFSAILLVIGLLTVIPAYLIRKVGKTHDRE